MKPIVMKKSLFACLLAAAATSAFADWKAVAEIDNATYYYDPSTIRIDGHLRKVWELHDFKKPTKNGEMSVRLRREYDCKEERNRGLSLTSHTQPMANGEVRLNSNATDLSWTEIPPKTLFEAILKLVCAK